jgi:hypothetical protein
MGCVSTTAPTSTPRSKNPICNIRRNRQRVFVAGMAIALLSLAFISLFPRFGRGWARSFGPFCNDNFSCCSHDADGRFVVAPILRYLDRGIMGILGPHVATEA